MAAGGVTYKDVLKVLYMSAHPDASDALHTALSRFIYQHEHVFDFNDANVDDLSELARAIKDGRYDDQRGLLYLLYKTMRLLTRKPVNQKFVCDGVVAALVAALDTAVDVRDADSCLELCGALGNLGLNKATATPLCRAGLAFVTCLTLDAANHALTASAATALQSLSLTNEGKRAAIENNAVPLLLSLLKDTQGDAARQAVVLAPVLGALHNLSGHLTSTKHFLNYDGVALALACLPHADTEIKRCAAGILQSLTRDKECLEQMKGANATEGLVDILTEDDIGVQVAAIGALLNIHGSCDEGTGNRQRLKDMLSCLITSSAIRDAASKMPGKDPDLDFYRHREYKPGVDAAPAAQPVRVMNANATTSEAKAGESSPWNAAGTWEEKGKKAWAIDALKKHLVGVECECEGGKVVVKEIVATGDASITFTRGKKKWPFDFKLEFTIEGPNDMKCEVVIPDFACDECAPYDMDFTWKGETASRTDALKKAVGATSKQVNAKEGLFYHVHEGLARWFEEFKASC